MILQVLGSAAGGGFPQWNCGCANCRRARDNMQTRMNASLAVSIDGREWYLINATPDCSKQIQTYAALHPAVDKVRHSPIRGVLLTDAELDHTIGLLHLRESAQMEVYGTAPILHALELSFPIQQILEPYAHFNWVEVKSGESFSLFEGILSIYPFVAGFKPPRYASAFAGSEQADWVMGYRLKDSLTGGTVIYAPGIEAWTPELAEHLEYADCILIDGTFWQSTELRSLGISELTAYDMGHIPISGAGGSLQHLTKLSAQRKIYIHINNTNPILDQESVQFRHLQKHGIEVGYDGLKLEV